MSKKKSSASFSQKNDEEELSEESLCKVAGGKILLTGDPEFDRRQIEGFRNLPHVQNAENARKQDEANARIVSDLFDNR